MTVVLTVNGPALKKELIQSIARMNNATQIRNSLMVGNQLLVKKFESMKSGMIKEFLNLPVTKEILNGPDSRNISGTLGGYGNLFSFIGFNQSDDPIGPIVDLLERSMIKVSRATVRGTISVTIEIPSPQDIFRVTPLPWAPGISWAQRIEVGLSGLGQYMNKDSAISRSGTGVQIKPKIRTGKFSNTRYVSSFIKKWQKKFLDIERSIKL